MNTPLDLIRIARGIIAAPGAWCQTSFARMSNGEPCAVEDARAVSWCASGATILAIRRAGMNEGHDDGAAVIDVLYRTHVAGYADSKEGDEAFSPVKFNDFDHRTQDEVVAWFDALIAELTP